MVYPPPTESSSGAWKFATPFPEVGAAFVIPKRVAAVGPVSSVRVTESVAEVTVTPLASWIVTAVAKTPAGKLSGG
jgi:hypothetical protein